MSRPLNSHDECGLQHFIYVRTTICQVKSVDLYPSIVLLAWSLARSDEIDLSAIAVKREILQFVIAYCSLDL